MKFSACGPQRVRGTLGAEHKDWQTRLAYRQRQSAEVAVPGDDTECFAATKAQFGHDVDHKCDVRGILPRRVAEYLDGADAEVAKEWHVSYQSGAIGVPANGIPAWSKILKDRTNGNIVADVINVDEDSELQPRRQSRVGVFRLVLLWLESQFPKPLN
jgi:hypothetical protein